MTETIVLGRMAVEVTRKSVKNVHLSVHPPDGRVSLVAPADTRLEVARAYVASRLGWIRAQQAALRGQARETERQFLTRESHYVWGRRYLLLVVERDGNSGVSLDHRRMTLTVRPGSTVEVRGAVIHEWHKELLHRVVPDRISEWERRIGVAVAGYGLRRMKTKWGSANVRSARILLNTELVKKPKDLLDYVIVHEMLHLLEPTHSDRFIELLGLHCPHWREARAELNALPLRAENWLRLGNAEVDCAEGLKAGLVEGELGQNEKR